MEYYSLEQYFSFTCLAGDCPSTCCAGWNILVDEQDYQRFCQLDSQGLRKDILTHIRKKGENYFFQNREDGRCAMLDDDGLCRIQKNSSEETLCNTCRKYPRLLGERQGVYYFSMAASCPVISQALWRGRISFVHGSDSGKIDRISGEELPLSLPVWTYFRHQGERVAIYRHRIGREELFWDSLGNLLELVADILPELPRGESVPMEEIMLFYADAPEEEVSEKITEFFNYDAEKWKQFIFCYLTYRFFCCQMMQKQEPEETFCQSMGEMFMIQAFCFLAFWKQGALCEENICEWIQRTYRVCAHGKQSVTKIQQIFSGFYQEKSLWNYLLLG